jgi:lysophospholipase L1-like esterase
LLLVGSICVALASAEIVIRLFVPVRDVGALFTDTDPIMGKRIKKNFHTVRVTPEFTMTFTSNSFGFRGPEAAMLPVRPVVFLGDSFTMGFGVSDGEEYPVLIKEMLDASFGKNAIEIVNTGMGDNGNGRWIKLLRADVERLKPRLVVLQVAANDFNDNVREALFSVLDNGVLVEAPVKVGRARTLERISDAIPGLSSSHFYALVRQVVASLLSRAPAAPAPEGYADRLTVRLIEEAVSICQKREYPIVAVLVGLSGVRLARIQSIFESRQIPVLVAPTKVERPDLHYKIDGHWNAAGHVVIARAVFDRLLTLKLIQGK